MLRKEILDTIRQAGTIAGFGLLIPLVYLVNQLRLADNPGFIHYMNWGLSILIPAILIYMAYMVFNAEEKDRALEYLKSLPVTGAGLLYAKLLPRLILGSAIVLLPFLELRAGSLAYFLGADYLDSIAFRLLLLFLLMVSGFFIGLMGRKSPAVILYLLFPLWFLLHSGAGSILTIKSIYAFYFHVLEPLEIQNVSVFRTSYTAFYVIFTVLPALAPVMSLLHMYGSWDCSSPGAKTVKGLKQMGIPMLLLVTLFFLKVLNLW